MHTVIAGIFRGPKFSRRPLWLYYSNYSRVEFSRYGEKFKLTLLPKLKTDLVTAGVLLERI